MESHGVSWRCFVNGLVFMLGTLWSCPGAWGAPAAQYQLIDLGEIEVTFVSKEEAQVVGSTNIDGQVLAQQFYPVQVSGMLLPGSQGSRTLAAHTGRIVGQSWVRLGRDPVGHAFLREADGTLVDLGTLGGAAEYSVASTIIYDDICGYGDNRTRDKIVPICWIGETALELPTLANEDGYVERINERGNAVGSSNATEGDLHCAYWPVEGGVIDCHPEGGGTFSTALDINTHNLFVGTAGPVFNSRGFLGLPYGRILLPPLAGDTHSEAHSINDLGDIVGRSCVRAQDPFSSVCTAIIYQNGVAVSLNDSLPPGLGWTLRNAIGINNDGVIVVLGQFNQTFRSAVLLPVDDPVTAWYKWRYRILRYYQQQYARWQKQIARYYAMQVAQH